MRSTITVGFLLFCFGLGAVVGYKLAPDQLGVVVGVILGVLAGIPAAVLMMVAMRARRTPEPMPLASPPQQPAAPVIIVGPAGMPAALTQNGGETWPEVGQAVERNIRVVGE